MSTPATAKMLASNFAKDFSTVGQIIKAQLPQIIDGKIAISSMKSGGSRHWRQMEWIGFYLEFFVETTVLPLIGGQAGPTYGRTKFDLMLSGPWDLKAHPGDQDILILNDVEAVDKCVADYGALNYLILKGVATYDDSSRSFKTWHDMLKGKPSKYVNEGVAIGRTSRRRKVSFKPQELVGIHIMRATLQKGLQFGAVGYFQQGMKNSNGNPRRGKYQLNPQLASTVFVSSSITL